MSSFFEKAIRTATRAKEQVDELRAKRDGEITPNDASPLGDHEREVLAHATRAGAPDPFGLLTQEEAAGVLGVPVGAPSLSYTDDAVGVRFSASSRGGKTWSLTVSVVHGSEGDPVDGPGYWRDMVVDMFPDAEPVADVGDQARWNEPYLFVLQGATVFYVDVTTPEGPDDVRRRASTAAAIVGERLQAR